MRVRIANKETCAAIERIIDLEQQGRRLLAERDSLADGIVERSMCEMPSPDGAAAYIAFSSYHQGTVATVNVRDRSVTVEIIEPEYDDGMDADPGAAK